MRPALRYRVCPTLHLVPAAPSTSPLCVNSSCRSPFSRYRFSLITKSLETSTGSYCPLHSQHDIRRSFSTSLGLCTSSRLFGSVSASHPARTVTNKNTFITNAKFAVSASQRSFSSTPSPSPSPSSSSSSPSSSSSSPSPAPPSFTHHPRLPSRPSKDFPMTRFSPIGWKSVAVLVIGGAIAFAFYQYERERVIQEKLSSDSASAGRPLIGGPFSLIDDNGRPVNSSDLHGSYTLIYFGFTHCPDVCPNELKKLSEAFDLFSSEMNPHKVRVIPIFISVDPHRDSPERLHHYRKDIEKSSGILPKEMLWLTGNEQQVKEVAKAFRVYYSAPELKGGDDAYLVDHSIFFYLMDRNGELMDYYGKQWTANEMAFKMAKQISEDNQQE